MTSEGGDAYCEDTVRGALDIIGSKWSMRILWELLQEQRRYAELQRRVTGISQKVLSSQLKTLVNAGVVEREVTPTVPPQVTYRLTPQGRDLQSAVAALHDWGRRAQPTETQGRHLSPPLNEHPA